MRYGEVVAVDGIDVDIQPGEFLTLLGPSGSGKTSTLSMIAGFLRPTSGVIQMDGIDIRNLPSHRRGFGVVFQDYSLFPHMTVGGNVAFPLDMRGWAKTDSLRAVGEALEMVELGGYQARYPRQLSGGQQQRVALARAIVFKPRVLLMDEPLGSLDKNLRESLGAEIQKISRHVGATVVYVTHDQSEALLMSDRIALYRAGQIAQMGTPKELYERPSSIFAAQFLGASVTLHGVIRLVEGRPHLAGDGWEVALADTDVAALDIGERDRAALVIRPERLLVQPAGRTRMNRHALLAGSIEEVLYLGSSTRLAIKLSGGTIVIASGPSDAYSEFRTGESVDVSWNPEHARLLRAGDPATSEV
jgi:putative spermidine/putrescine transport system ATP-binding protein